MRKYKLFIGYRLLGEFSGIWEAKNFAAESGMSGIFSLVGENYRDSWYEPKKQDKNGNKDYRHHGSGNNRYRLKRGGTPMPGVPRKSLPDALGAYRGGKPCLHVAATARPAKAETGTRQATAVKIRREKNRTITTVRFFCFPSIDRRMVAQLPVQFTPDMSGNATGRNFRD